ncbi:YeeE/YedE thiosulfate transporter family protein [Diaphorobacter caeni]|uniref:YeeE/YedE thiosulfate transporter family protein n=1 Tax=Diaphorobacter caeni TaxID=2784387 RepID=UPI00188FC00D|nr:YeeE/YedE thiosulfate transporter family protein [Diaphorobacter caeni]MBF5004660.1 YeeE/YedE family protein [Diaphorobacter caeni]
MSTATTTVPQGAANSASPTASGTKRLPLAIVFLVFFGWLLWTVSVRQAALFAVGIGLGAVLAGKRFGFTTGWRMLIEEKDASGVFGQLLLLALAAAMAMPLLGHFPELTAALGPPSISLLVGAFVFGLCMQIADGCGSGTLYKAGMGFPMNTAILPMFAIGSFLGSLSLGWWLDLGALPPVGLVTTWGWQYALVATLAALAVVAIAVAFYTRGANARLHRPAKSLFSRRWLVGAVLLAILATLNLLIAGQPWGVVYGFGLWAAKIASASGAIDLSQNWFWSQPGNAARLHETVLLDVTSITNIGILGGALWVAAAKPASATPLTGKQWVVALVAGLILGYSSRLAFGCNVGAMFSGISTGSIHGWIWVPLAFAGTIFGLRIRRHFGM